MKQVRGKTASFIGAASGDEIVLTSGCDDGAEPDRPQLGRATAATG
jgi:hypothetical protein